MAFRLIRARAVLRRLRGAGATRSAGRGAARGDARARPADLGQGGRDQGSRAPVRHPDARDHPAPAPHLRHAARPRGHPRRWPARSTTSWTPSTRRRRSCGSIDSSSVRPDARELAGIIRPRTDQIVRGAAGAREAHRRRRAGGRDQPARERGRPRPPGGGAAAVRRGARPDRVIKWKEILDLLEEATDRCEDVANVARRRRREARLSARWTPTCSPSSRSSSSR